MVFIPNEHEEAMLAEITKRSRAEYTLIRMTNTMINKSIIDASASFRNITRENGIVDYKSLVPGGEKLYCEALIIVNDVYESKVSLYRPKTKNGDPRFWIYGLKNILSTNDLVYISFYKGRLVIIPLVHRYFSVSTLNKVYESESIRLRKELFDQLIYLKNKGPVLSVSPFKRNPKDVGDTLERELGIAPNSKILADYKGKIELKAKRDGSGTKDTLFSMVPNWDKSFINSSNQMILTYGYPSNDPKYRGYIDLYVTVHNRPNNQGLSLGIDEDNNLLHQWHLEPNGKAISTCVWDFDDINSRLNDKHPETVWVVAQETVHKGKIHFVFDRVEHTQKPIFSSFIVQIGKGIVTYDWRGRVRWDGTGYKDKGHCFRISPKYRHTIFGETNTLNI
ncbi:MvaI/BcnI family restriction endonuclease [Ruminiclostridium papyrosolvens]|uniref:MvaI/BcnI restriction endonuclease domain-containing protein n=1 Tax=Ruminiclostridium papyrosolvens C7 TaxID=1330534 RepID=U4R6A9_9FIRM|nr:MvaI/BcnI family restriction endonuclease [Ruminiclostridium papyrosolvens]EPR13998.1 hypothetical protein L323_01680 [Ruminiclostridium papyrosolvens C7]